MECEPPAASTHSPLRLGQQLGPGWMLLLRAETAESSLVTAPDFKATPGVFTVQFFLVGKKKKIYLYISLVSLGRQQQTQSPSLSPSNPASAHRALFSKELHNKLHNRNP